MPFLPEQASSRKDGRQPTPDGFLISCLSLPPDVIWLNRCLLSFTSHVLDLVYDVICTNLYFSARYVHTYEITKFLLRSGRYCDMHDASIPLFGMRDESCMKA